MPAIEISVKAILILGILLALTIFITVYLWDRIVNFFGFLASFIPL